MAANCFTILQKKIREIRGMPVRGSGLASIPIHPSEAATQGVRLDRRTAKSLKSTPPGMSFREVVTRVFVGLANQLLSPTLASIAGIPSRRSSAFAITFAQLVTANR